MKGMITVAKNSNKPEFIDYAYNQGVRYFRLNMDYETEAIDSLNMIEKLGLDGIEIFGDFQGVKMRVQLPNGISEMSLKVNDLVTFWRCSNIKPYISNFFINEDYVKIGTLLGFSDNRIIGEIIAIGQENILVKILESTYPLRQNAGCNLIASDVPSPRMTPEICKQIAKSEVIVKKKIDWVILSFVERVEDIKDFVNTMHACGLKVMAKIETPTGVDNIQDISEMVDGLMIGRGDLSSLSGEKYPKIYSEVLNFLSSSPHLFSGVGTFFLANYSQTGVVENKEIEEIEALKQINIKFIMLSKEVVNSNYPYETLNLLQTI